MLGILTLVLNTVADAFINQVVTLATDKVKEKLQRDPGRSLSRKRLQLLFNAMPHQNRCVPTLVPPLLEQKKLVLKHRRL